MGSTANHKKVDTTADWRREKLSIIFIINCIKIKKWK